MLDLEDQIRRYAEAVGERTEPAIVTAHGPGEPQSRRRWPMAIAAGLMVAGLAAGLVVRVQTGDDQQPAGPTAAEEVEFPEPGTWERLPEAPIAAREGAAVVVAGDELIVWGGSRYPEPDVGAHDQFELPEQEFPTDGAVYSFADRTWRTMASPAISGRSYPFAVWTGREMVVWGGRQFEPGGGDTVHDAAAYDPSTDSWRTVAGFQGYDQTGPIGAVWTGDEVVQVGAVPLDGLSAYGQRTTVAVNPVTGAVRHLDPIPTSAAADGWRTAVWTGEEVVVATVRRSDRTIAIDRLDPVTEAWAPTISTGLDEYTVGPERVALLGDDVVVESNLTDGVRIDLATGRVGPLPAARSAAHHALTSLGSSTLTVGDRWFDADASVWRDASVPDPQREFPASLDYRGHLVLWGGSTCGVAASCASTVAATDGLIWTPPSDGADTAPRTTPTTASVPSCAEVQRFLELNSGITYDYTASTSPRDLANRADAVVEGRLTGATTETEWVTFDIAVDEVLRGEAGPQITAAIEISPAISGDPYVRLLPVGARVIAFLHEPFNAPAAYQIGQPEGFYLDCPGTDTIEGDSPGWAEIDELDDIVSALDR